MTEANRLAAWLTEGAWHQMTLGDVIAAGRELRRLQAENEALRADAERYRCIRNPPYSDNWGDIYAMTFQRSGDMVLNGEQLDYAADAARAKEQTP
jgi:hypothetical protein